MGVGRRGDDVAGDAPAEGRGAAQGWHVRGCLRVRTVPGGLQVGREAKQAGGLGPEKAVHATPGAGGDGRPAEGQGDQGCVRGADVQGQETHGTELHLHVPVANRGSPEQVDHARRGAALLGGLKEKQKTTGSGRLHSVHARRERLSRRALRRRRHDQVTRDSDPSPVIYQPRRTWGRGPKPLAIARVFIISTPKFNNHAGT